MITKELTDYIKGEAEKGASLGTIKSNLLAVGWNSSDIDEAFLAITPVPQIPIAAPEVAHNLHAPRNRSFIFSIILILVLISGGAIYAYYNADYFAVSPEKLIEESTIASSGIKASSFEMNFELDLSGIKNDPLITMLNFSHLSAAINGAYDALDPSNFKLDATVTINAGLMNPSLDVRGVGGMSYVRIKNLVPLPLLPNTNQLQNKWISYEDKSLSNNGSPYSFLVPNNTQKQLTQVQKQEIAKYFNELKVMKFSEKLADDRVDSTNTYHFKFVIDKESLKSYFAKVSSYLAAPEEQANLETSIKLLNEQIDLIKSAEGEIWIGKKDKIARKMVINLKMSKNKDSTEEFGLNFGISLSKFGVPLTVEAPADAMPIESIFSSLSPAHAEADARLKIMNLRVSAELYYDKQNSYAGVCSSPEFIKTKSELEKISGVEQFSCSSMIAKYVVSVKLPNKNFWCVDSTGSSISLEKAPLGMACQ
jgi:hypothetical protein